MTSLQVAEAFEKNHRNVLADIASVLSQVSENFVKANFEVYEYPVNTGIGTRMAKAYLLTKDGFSMLAMGYNGSKAFALKEYILAKLNAYESGQLSPFLPACLPTFTAYAHALPSEKGVPFRYK